jgi:glycosyltransferase involved in cell wall biosynthesis
LVKRLTTPPALTFLIPGNLETRTGGYEYDRRMVEGLDRLGWHVNVLLLGDSFPRPTLGASAFAGAVLASLPDGALVLVDGLAFGAMANQAEMHTERLRLVALVHHPLALETGLDAAEVARLRETEARALATARRVIVTSHATVSAVASYGVTRDHITVVEPGTDVAALARGSDAEAPALLCVASVTPRKGHNVLVEALGRLRSFGWTLTCVGSTTLDPAWVDKLTVTIGHLGLSGRISLVGEAEREATSGYYDRSDVFVLPTLYEGYGMVVAEALARGLPVISTPTGAIPDLVGPDAGLLVPAGDVSGWEAALREVLRPEARARLAEGARHRRTLLRTWDASATDMAAALEQNRRSRA